MHEKETPHQADGCAATQLSGWGANLRVTSYLCEPQTPDRVAAFLDPAGTIARGLGRSYGDAAINAGGRVIGMTRTDRYLGFDERTGTLECEAGVTLEQIIRDFAPRGWFPMITPGTKFVTVGGCIASDVHGKAHHVQGSFSTCLDSMTVLLANREIVIASRDENPDLFFAMVGGMGLLGIVLTAKIRLRKIETTWFSHRSLPVKNLEEMLHVLEEQDRLLPYSVATLDVFAKGARLGRGVVAVGDHARLDDLPSALRAAPLHVSPPATLRVPFDMPEFSLNRMSIGVVNAAIQWLLKRPRAFVHYDGFFYPLDGVLYWNRGYGRRGFTQYQFVIPFDNAERNLRELLTVILSAGELPFLNVLKRLGHESGGLLSFPREGYTLAIDFPIRRHTVSLLRRLDRMVLEAGGRVYLAKDSYLEADIFRAMYPQAERWLVSKAKYDPHGIFTSNLGRRLGLVSQASASERRSA